MLLIKTYKSKENFSDNHVHNILRLFDGWASNISNKLV